MTDSLVAKRLRRNLRYKKTYVQVYQAYLEPEPIPRLASLLRALMEAQEAAIVPLERYLVDVGDGSLAEKPYEKLLADAAKRRDLKSRLRFLHTGLTRSVSWYRMQLTDQQMTSDPRLTDLLFELGEIEATQLWRTEAAMRLLRISLGAVEPEEDAVPRQPPESEEGWQSRLAEEKGRPEWGGYSNRPPRPTRRRQKR